jgi:DNA primase
MFDLDAIKQRHNLLNVIGADTSLKRVAGTEGGEYAGPCPFCGGTDRLRVQPQRGRWFCRQCTGSPEQAGWHDVIDYIIRRDNLSFTEACERLGGGGRGAPPQRATPSPPLQPELSLKEPPPADWQVQAWRIVEECEAALWADGCEAVRRWLNDERGLTDETIRRWRLGFNAVDQELHGIWMSRGVTIPRWHGETLWTVNVRRGQGQRPKYKQIKGGRTGLFGLDTLDGHDMAVITEGEFDAMLLHQEAGDLVGVITLGSASPRHFETWLPWLLRVERLLVAYDNDAEGREGLEFWLETTKRAREMRVPEGKDVTDFHQAGGDLRAWVTYHLDRLGAKKGKENPDPLLERLEAAWREVEPGGPKANDEGMMITFQTLLVSYEQALAAA